MHGGEPLSFRRLWRGLAAFVLLVGAAGAGAIDNPDSPDRVGVFERRAADFEKQLAATDGGSAASRAGHAYASFLDAQLNQAYGLLVSRVEGPAREALVRSQRRWLQYRDAEYEFIARHWTAERSGSSASLSVEEYRNGIVKQRVLQLLRYAAEYP